MTDIALSRRPIALEGDRVLAAVLAALVAAGLLARLYLVFRLNINWDEFLYLDKVHRYLGGRISQPLQTLQVHFFTWLPQVAQNEVDQVIAARLAMYVLLVGSAGLTWLVARHFLDRASALFAVLCYVSLSYAVEHGTSFRADPIAGFLFLASVAALLKATGRVIGPATAGLAAAMALMITIKSLFYLPVLGAMLLVEVLPRRGRGEALRRLAVFGCVLPAGFAVLYLLHRATLAEPAIEVAARLVGSAADKVIMLDQLFPRWTYLARTLIDDAAIWVALLIGTAVVASRAAQSDRLPRQLLLLAFLLALATLAFYRNAFPYYYVFLLSPAVVLCGVAYQRVLPSRTARNPGQRYGLAAACALVVALGLGRVCLEHWEDATRLQRRTVALVHEMFPEPVAYIDRTTTIASFPKVGFFMSSWGIESYRAAGVPIFRALLLEKRPLFLLADRALIDPRIDQTAVRESGRALFAEDYRTLVDNYVHHWGDLYVAGKTLRFEGGAGTRDFEILIPGTYTLEAATAIEIDGAPVAPGETVALEIGRHRAAAPRGGAAVLRWGRNLPRPREPAPPGPLFTGF